MAPRIGLTTSYEAGEQRLPRRYVRAVDAAGGAPILLPMGSARAQRAAVALIDGLLVPGGPAVSDGLVGTLPGDLSPLDLVRADSDRLYLRESMARGLPVLGICYGMQRLNAMLGGTIYGDVEQQCDGAAPHSQKRGATQHPIHIEETSRLYRALQKSTVRVNTRHLQAVASVGQNLRIAATSPDGVVEAIEHVSEWMVGVQFHPERMGAAMQPLFDAFVQHAAQTAAA